MSYAKSQNDRPDSIYLRNPTSPREEPPLVLYASPLSPIRNMSGRVNASLQPSAESRGSLQRRFTTNALPTLSPIGQQRRLAAEPKDYTTSQSFGRITPAERKARQYEELLAQQRRIQAQMALIDPETRREVDEVRRMEQDITRFTSGVLSEPTTPPEYHSSAYPTFVSRPNRYSSTSMASPPGLSNRTSRSGSQLTSPPTSFARPVTSQVIMQNPSQSVPGSRRNSDEEEEDDYIYQFTGNPHRAAANPNRNSMPVTAMDLRNQSGSVANLSSLLGSVNTASFLFGDDETPPSIRQAKQLTASPDAKTYLQLHTTDDKFPILVRREGDGNAQLSASSAGLDLALSQLPGPEDQPSTDRTTASRHRQSLPPSAMRQTAFLAGDAGMSPLNGILTDMATAKNTAANRRSLEVKFSGLVENKRPALLPTPMNGATNGLPRLQSSYSTNDIPTLKSTSAIFPHQQIVGHSQNPHQELVVSDIQSPPPQPPTANTLGNRQSQNAQSYPNNRDSSHDVGTVNSNLQASAAPFGPSASTSAQTPHSAHLPINGIIGGATPSMAAPYGAPAYYGGYGMQMLTGGMNNMYIGNQGQWPLQTPTPAPAQASAPTYQGALGGYPQYPQPTPVRFPDNQTRVMQQRRNQNGDETARFANVRLESLAGEIFGLCKDQHGCRYLQKKLEDRNPEHVQIIFEETSPHVIELMTDPFGNYLCQKLLENTNDEQRTALIRNATPQMVKIAVNQHGTRALQKMIEFVSTPLQIAMITEALQYEVVQLIQDLNGNHVIQKCLNHLSAEDSQFIFDAVCAHVVTVGTHRHGCCVLQRCVDHASGLQKGQLVGAITNNAFSLVTDPFGNYVVQYILDLGEPSFSQPLCRVFCGNVAILSRQKFSSNVIEKCIRTADESTKRLLIEDMINSVELEKLLRDSFANYCVQTAMDYADPETRARLYDCIRPILPSIRHTPHGRRIQGKMQEYDTRMGGPPSGQITPSDTMSPGQGSLPSRGTPYSRQSNGLSSYTSPSSVLSSGNSYASNGIASGINYTPNFASPTPQRNGNPSMYGQNANQYQVFAALGRAPQSNGMGHF